MIEAWMIRVLIFVAAISSAFIGGCVTGSDMVQSDWDADKLVRLQAARTAEQAFRIKEQHLMTKINEAQNAATIRETKLRADYAAVQRTAISLRDTVAARRRELPSASADACRSTADAALAIFGECSAQLGEVAAAADGHASDKQTLIEAWPQ